MARRCVALVACAACLLAPQGESRGQDYHTILDSSESQTPQGVRGAGGSDVVLACSYTLSGGLPQGMWWKGSLTTRSGVAYKVSPVISGQTVTPVPSAVPAAAPPTRSPAAARMPASTCCRPTPPSTLTWRACPSRRPRLSGWPAAPALPPVLS
ncbi:MAG: hypothetical protein WCJ18_08090 [Planctomycetota bacterium]